MDLPVLIGIAVALLVVILTALFFGRQRSGASDDKPAARGAPQRVQQRADVAPLSRAQIARNQRNRARATAAAALAADEQAGAPATAGDASSDGDSDDDGRRSQLPGAGEKIGAKKRAKLEAKAAKAMQREADLELREERRKRDELADEERRKRDAAEELAEQKRERAEREEREAQERREREEYERMRAAFSVEEEGFDEQDADDAEAQNRLQQFVEHIRTKKSVALDELAREFRLKTPQCIERLQELKANGTLTGVLDDRGKFIYITDAELEAVAEFVQQRGRVSISELAESSNRLIRLSTDE